MDTIMSIFTIAVTLLIASLVYWANVDNFSKIFLPMKLSHKSPYYAQTTGNLKELAIEMSRIRSGNGTTNSFSVVGDYTFFVEGKSFSGLTNLGATNVNFINYAIEDCQRYFPNQIIHLKTDVKKLSWGNSPLGEYNLYLKGMNFDFHPTQKTTSVDVYYEVLHPENNCLKIDASASVIAVYIFLAILWSAIGAFFVMGILPGEKTVIKYLLGLAIMSTGCVPAYFTKSKLPQTQISKVSEDNGIVTMDLVIDQNNSEQYIKDQILKQEEKLGLNKEH